jgi:hypothetical protein
MVDNTQLDMRNAQMHYVPPNVHRGHISKIWPDFRNLTPHRECFFEKIEIYSNIALQRGCPNKKLRTQFLLSFVPS